MLILPLAGLAAGAALYARQQSALRAMQGKVSQLEADLDRAQAAARQLESRDATLEVQNAELGLRLTQVAPTSAPTQPSESEVNEGLLIPHCVLYASEEGYQAAFAANSWVDPQIIEGFFADPSVTATWANGTLYQMCYSDRHAIAFIVYGEFEGFEGTNNLIGIFTGERVIAHHLFNPSSGDIGLCAIEGFIDGSVVYSCGGGDGPAGWDTVSVLDGDRGESQVIRDCRFTEGGTHCTVDLLDLGG
jgi:hypothetical protein